MGRLFGTDGVRGVANRELTCELAVQVGRAAATVLTRSLSHRPRVLIGKDTRASGDMLEAALAAGLCSVGANVELLGVVPTPAVAYLTAEMDADAGVMISASHNPCEDNGIKIFGRGGYKLSDELENQVEALIIEHEAIACPTGGGVGRVSDAGDACERYAEHLIAAADADLTGLHIAVDCANGSASRTARRIFETLGVNCDFLSCAPDGENINLRCGSTHLTQLIEYVKAHGVDAGFAFDGDADRCLCVAADGTPLDGDAMLAILAKDFKARGRLARDAAVVTVMSNLGFFRYAEEHGIRALQTAVGDRYILEEMLSGGYALGAEQSGHLISLTHATTGDGQLSAILLLCAMRRAGLPLQELAKVMTSYPQVMVNVRLHPAGKARYHEDEAIAARVREVAGALADSGRVLVRPSGTEPLVRVMVEHTSAQEAERIANELAAFIRERLGSPS